jgi:hypothetical protein
VEAAGLEAGRPGSITSRISRVDGVSRLDKLTRAGAGPDLWRVVGPVAAQPAARARGRLVLAVCACPYTRTGDAVRAARASQPHPLPSPRGHRSTPRPRPTSPPRLRRGAMAARRSAARRRRRGVGATGPPDDAAPSAANRRPSGPASPSAVRLCGPCWGWLRGPELNAAGVRPSWWRSLPARTERRGEAFDLLLDMRAKGRTRRPRTRPPGCRRRRTRRQCPRHRRRRRLRGTTPTLGTAPNFAGAAAAQPGAAANPVGRFSCRNGVRRRLASRPRPRHVPPACAGRAHGRELPPS